MGSVSKRDNQNEDKKQLEDTNWTPTQGENPEL